LLNDRISFTQAHQLKSNFLTFCKQFLFVIRKFFLLDEIIFLDASSSINLTHPLSNRASSKVKHVSMFNRGGIVRKMELKSKSTAVPLELTRTAVALKSKETTEASKLTRAAKLASLQNFWESARENEK